MRISLVGCILQDCRRYLILFCRLMTMNIMCIELTTYRVIPQKQDAFLWTTVWQMIFHHHTLLSMVIMFVMVRCCQIWLGLKIKPYTMKNHISGFWLRKVTTVIRFSPFSSAIAQQMFFRDLLTDGERILPNGKVN